MDHSAEFLDAPSEEDVSRFFSLEREINTLALSPAQRHRRDSILGNITQFLGSRKEFTRFLQQLERLLEEVKTEGSRVKVKDAVTAAPAGNAKFKAYLDEFEHADEERLREIIRAELDKLPKAHLIFLYTVIMGSAKCLGPDDGRPSASR